MIRNDYKPNSHRYKEEKKQNAVKEKKVEKIVKGKARIKKKNSIYKLTDVFVPEDVTSIRTMVVTDVLIPYAKKIISDTVDMFLYGESGRNSKVRENNGRTPYRSYYDNGYERRSSTNRARSVYSYDDVILDTRGEAEEVLSAMDDIIAEYGIVSVLDLYDLVGISSSPMDAKYGWTDIRTAKAVRYGDGYILRLPRALVID